MRAPLLFLGLAMLGGSLPARAVDEQAPPDAAATTPVLIPGVVTRSQITHGINDLEPVDIVSVLTNDQTRIVYFTEIHDMAGQTVLHRWEYKGKIIMEVPIKVGTARWRAYSTKTLLPSWIGDWKVSVVDAAGGTLSVNTFTYLNKPDDANQASSVAANPRP